ncbi:hypothetical protein HIM_11144 [Hirsutella minnesotensis 3608]|uniref:Uncharacterized protein n=1 Tax=Hirsutella minnesotensis 3608 TaxID=1043627 RepID=A0A0F7ZFN7_9HYPO|nr:hypothetical protein HIM_11144 [Hirsutella minnesotensis 3608]
MAALSALTLALLMSAVLSLQRWGPTIKRKCRMLSSLERDKRSRETKQNDDIRSLRHKHEIASVFLDLVEQDGAGSWPPRVDYDSWPAPLQPYQEIYHIMSPLLSTSSPSLSDEYNAKRMANYRMCMRQLLSQRVVMQDVESIMNSAESGNWTALHRSQCNGFYCIIGVLRHAYRWATIPVVRVAQAETVVEFPRELHVPWQYLQRIFGCTAESGNNTSNVLHNRLSNHTPYTIQTCMTYGV